jgi:hypothetical protein
MTDYYPDPQTHCFMEHTLEFPPPVGWKLIAIVTITSGGGSYRDRELRDQIAGVGTAIRGIFAKEMDENDRKMARVRFSLGYRADGYAEWLTAKVVP